jgi:hypothetical protein
MNHQVDALFAQSALERSIQSQFTLQSIIGRAFGFDVKVDIATQGLVAKPRAKQQDARTKPEVTLHFFPDGGLVLLAEPHCRLF